MRRGRYGRGVRPVAVLAMLGAAWGGAQAGQQAVAAQVVNVIAVHSGKCLEAESSSLEAGAQVVQTDCAGQAGAGWKAIESPSGGGAVRLENAGTGKCLTIPTPTKGAAARQGDCTRAAGADLFFTDRGSHAWIQPATTGTTLCLEVTSGRHNNGAWLRLASCGGQSGTAFQQRTAEAGNATPGETPPGDVERVSVSTAGTESTGVYGSTDAAVSANGRYVVFEAYAKNLVEGDANETGDVFVRDRQTDTLQLVSTTASGAQGNSYSYGPSISADGRYVVFNSWASNLVPGDTNNEVDVFLKDLQTGAISRVSLTEDHAQANNGSYGARISANGRYVAFTSRASNLVEGDTNGASDPYATDIFVRDLLGGGLQRVSVASDRTQGNGSSDQPSISADGRYVVFSSDASSLLAGGGVDTNNARDVFMRDRQAGDTRRVSVGSGSAEGNGESSEASISADGRYISFSSLATNLVPDDTNTDGDVFVRDLKTAQTQLVSVTSGGAQGNSLSYRSSISADGRNVAFVTLATNFAPGDTGAVSWDIILKNRQTGTTWRASTAADGAEGNYFFGSDRPVISGDGSHVVYQSKASNFVRQDTNGTEDIFIRPLPRP